MKTQPILVALAAAAAAVAQADTVTLKDGSVLNGTLQSINGGTLVLETSYAGTLKVKQSEVVAFTTTTPVAVKTIDDNIIRGTVSAQGNTLSVASSGGTLTTSVDRVKASWDSKGEDPEITAQRRKWVYQVDLDVAGKQGNSKRFTTGAGATATLESKQDALKLYANYNYSEQEKVRSEDTLKVGADYAAYFSKHYSWYTFGEGGYDDIKDLTLRLRAGAGIGYALVKRPVQTLTARVGLGYRYEDYELGDANDVNSPGLDLGLVHKYDFGKYGVLNQSITVTPAFDDFGNYILTHDSSLTLPGGDWWNFRVGMYNEYTSEPPAGVGSWDTTYYAKVGLFWR